METEINSIPIILLILLILLIIILGVAFIIYTRVKHPVVKNEFIRPIDNMDLVFAMDGVTDAASKWDPVKRKKTVDDMKWGEEIYGQMVGDMDGGDIDAVTNFLTGHTMLTQEIATNICENPCWSNYNKPGVPQLFKDKIEQAGLCDCKTPLHIAINF